VIRGEVGNTGIAYCDDGPRDRPAIVFSNSLGTDHRLWDAQMPAVLDRCRVIRYDACGHGASDPPRGRVTIESLSNDLVALLDHLELERIVLCGCSLGGVIALWMCVNHPERVRGAVLANTGAKVGTDESWNTRIAAVREAGTASVASRVVGRFLTEEFRLGNTTVTSLITGMLLATDPAGYVAACEALREIDLRPVAPTVRAPTLIVGSDRDESTPPALARDLHASIPGSELVIIPGAAHLSNVERPDLFNASLVRFLDRL